MNNDLKNFLEEEFKDYGLRMSEDEDHFEYESPSPSKILDFANKVLSLVEKEVRKRYHCDTEEEQENEHNALDDAKWNKQVYEFLTTNQH